MANIDENQERKIFWATISLLLSGALTLWAMNQGAKSLDHTLPRVTLTAAGCEYVQRQTGLTGKSISQNGLCEMDGEFTQYQTSADSNIFNGYENSQSLHIAESQVVGAISLPEDPNKHWSHEQKVAGWRVALAVIFMLLNFIVFFRFNGVKWKRLLCSGQHTSSGVDDCHLHPSCK
jgi:hypothetical protein